MLDLIDPIKRGFRRSLAKKLSREAHSSTSPAFVPKTWYIGAIFIIYFDGNLIIEHQQPRDIWRGLSNAWESEKSSHDHVQREKVLTLCTGWVLNSYFINQGYIFFKKYQKVLQLQYIKKNLKLYDANFKKENLILPTLQAKGSLNSIWD